MNLSKYLFNSIFYSILFKVLPVVGNSGWKDVFKMMRYDDEVLLGRRQNLPPLISRIKDENGELRLKIPSVHSYENSGISLS